MKDKKLEQQFNEYFDGIEVPENLHEDAKKFVKTPEKKSAALSKVVKIASIAASFVLCFAVVIALILRSAPPVNAPDSGNYAADEPLSPPLSPDSYEPADPSGGDSQKGDSPSGESSNGSRYYYSDSLSFAYADPYTISGGNGALKFMENIALSNNAQITAQTASFKNGDRAFVYAEVTIINGVRDDTKIYVEFTDGVYGELKSYYSGERITYRGVTFYLTQEVDEYGEPVSYVFTQKDGVKYYFSVTSSDTDSYIKYLQLIYKNF